MSKQDIHDKDTKDNATPEQRSWRERYGMVLLIGAFGLMGLVMIVMQVKMTR